MSADARPFDLLLLRNFFDARTRAGIVAELRSAADGAATVYGAGEAGAVNERVRRASLIRPTPERAEFVRQRLLALKPEVEQHFGVRLGGCEAPQFLRYRVGDFFVAHQDGNTGLLRLAQEERRVSVVIFLSGQADAPGEGDYCGGSLVFHDWRPGPTRGARFHLDS